jgi:hypothetical protein
MGAVEAIRHDVFAAHGAVFSAFVFAGGCFVLFLFRLIGRRHPRDRDFERNDRFHRSRERELHWAAHLSAIDSRAHHGRKGAHVEEIVAHELAKLRSLCVGLRIEFLVGRSLFLSPGRTAT